MILHFIKVILTLYQGVITYFFGYFKFRTVFLLFRQKLFSIEFFVIDRPEKKTSILITYITWNIRPFRSKCKCHFRDIFFSLYLNASKLHVKSKFSNLKKNFSNWKTKKHLNYMLFNCSLQFTCNLRHNKIFIVFTWILFLANKRQPKSNHKRR